MRPALGEIEATVVRLESRLAASAHQPTKALLAHYALLRNRFSRDLDDPRDVALSRGAALMLVKAVDDAAGG